MVRLTRRNFLAATALSAALFFKPVPAHAVPVLGIIGGIVSGLGAPALGGVIAGTAGIASGAFITGASLGFAVSGTIGAFGVRTLLSLGISALAELLRPRPATPDPGAKMVNMRQPISYMEIAYGTVRKGGPVAFWELNDGSRYYDIVFAARAVDSFVSFYADEREPTLDGSGFATDSEYQSGGSSKLQIVGYDGQANVAPPLLTSAFPEWTSAHDMDGLAHAVVKATNSKSKDFATVYPTGREPVVTALLKGAMVYDPREVGHDPDDAGTWEWSDNAALILADWIVSTDGLGRSVDWDDVADEADIADSLVTNRNAATQAKWTLNGSYSLADERENVRAAMALACDAFIYERPDGKVGFRLGRYEAPTVTISDRAILSAVYTQGADSLNPVNAFVVEYTEPAVGYVEAPSAAIEADDAAGESYVEDSARLFWINSHNQACRVGNRLLRVARAELKAQLTLNLQGWRLMGQRFFRLAHAETGFDYTMEVDRLVRNDDGMTFSVECHSVTEADFAFNAATQEPAPPDRTPLETTSEVPAPTNVTADAVTLAGAVGVYVAWDTPPRVSLLTEVRYRLQDDGGSPGDWFELSVPAGQDYQNIVGLVDGEIYDIQARHTSATGRASEWSPNDGDEANPTLDVTVVLDSTPTGVPTAASATLDGSDVDVVATMPVDAETASMGVYRAARNWFDAASLVATKSAGPGTSPEYVDTTKPDGTVWYWVTARNGSGVDSTEVFADEVTDAGNNLFAESHDFSTWGAFAGQTANAADGWLSGASGATKILTRNAQTLHYKSASLSITSGNSYVVAIIAKAAEVTALRLYVAGGGQATTGRTFNLSAGTESAYSGSPTGYGITALSSAETAGWYLCWFSFTAGVTATTSALIRLGSADFTGNGTDGLLVDHAQAENGSTLDGFYTRTG